MSMIRDLYDNAMAENFFSILKCECIYRRKPQTRAQARKMIDEFIWFITMSAFRLPQVCRLCKSAPWLTLDLFLTL